MHMNVLIYYNRKSSKADILYFLNFDSVPNIDSLYFDCKLCICKFDIIVAIVKRVQIDHSIHFVGSFRQKMTEWMNRLISFFRFKIVRFRNFPFHPFIFVLNKLKNKFYFISSIFTHIYREHRPHFFLSFSHHHSKSSGW